MDAIQLLNPYALLLLPLIVVLLLLARLRAPRPRRPVANLYLWRQTAPVDPARMAFARLRRHRLLALQIAFMLAVIAALARPVLDWTGPHVTLVFDVSASMGARDGSSTRLDTARQRARAVLATLPSRTRVRLIAAGAAAVDRGEFAVLNKSLLTAIDGLQPTPQAARLDEAVALARSLDMDALVRVFSDTEPSGPLPSTLRWDRIGGSVANVAITALAGRRLPDSPDVPDVPDAAHGGQILVAVNNYGPVARDLPLEIRQNDSVIDRETMHLDAHSSRTVMVDVRPIGGTIAARIDVDDALAADNQRIAIVEPLIPIRVLLPASPKLQRSEGGTSAGSVFLEKALLANPVFAVDRQAAPGVRYDVVVCDGCADLPAGSSGVLMIAGTSATPEPLDKSAEAQHATPDLSAEAQGAKAERLTAADADVILRGGVPEALTSERDGRRVASLNLKRQEQGFVLTTVFPVLIANAVDWLAARDANRAANHALDDNPATETESNLESPLRLDLGPALAAPAPARAAAESVARLLLWSALALLLVEWRFWARSDRGRAALACRLAAVALTALAALGVKLPVGTEHESIIFAVDRSDSVSPRTQAAVLERVNAMARTMRSDDVAGVVAFGTDAALERRAAADLTIHSITSTVATTGTDIEKALRVARSALPPDGRRRIVLVSDGRETVGDARREAAHAAADGVRIDALAVDQPFDRVPIAVKSVTAPADVRVAEPFTVSVEMRGVPGVRGRLSVSSDGEPPLGSDIVVSADGTASVAVTDSRTAPGVYAYRAGVTVSKVAGYPDNDFGDEPAAVGTMVSVSGTPAALFVSASRGPVSPVARLLAAAGFRVSSVVPSAVTAGALAPYDVVVLDDVVPEELPQQAAEAIATYVEQSGGGLLVLGSPRSLDAAGYPEGPLGKLLPVDLRPRSGQRAPAMGLVVVFDKSGSMADTVGGVSKIELARQAVRKVIDVVRPSDSVGVIAFDAAPVVVSALAPSPDALPLTARLRAIEPGGSTAIAPALSEAVDSLRRARVTRRHVLLVSDGRTSAADAEHVRTLARSGGFELSAIAIGPDADRPLLEQLAAATGGRAYFPDDIRQLPILAAREASRAVGGGSVEERFTLRAVSHPIVAGVSRTAMPTMGGYVVATVRPAAEPVLVSHLNDPVLAAWRYGLGRVAVFTGDMNSPWTAGLRAWSGFAPLWSQVARWLSRGATDRTLHASVVDDTDGTRLVVEAETPTGRFEHLRDVRATVRRPNGTDTALVLAPTAPGRYEASLETSEPGAYVAAVSARRADGESELRALRGFYWSADRERRASGVDRATLTQLAKATGGRVISSDPGDNPFAEPRARSWREVWPHTMFAVLLLFLCEIAIRRGLRWRRRAPDAAPATPTATRAAA